MMYTSGAVVILALAGIVAVSEAQFGVRGGQQASRQAIDQEKLHEALSASEQGLDAHQAILQANQNIEETKDITEKTSDRRNLGSSSDFADRLQKQNELDFGTYNNEVHFNNLEADSDVSGGNKFGLTLVNENVFDESASIRQSDGAQSNSATKLAAHDVLNKEVQAQEEIIDQSEYFDGTALSATGASSDLLNAQEQSKQAAEASIDVESQRQKAAAYDNFFGGFGGHTGFGGRAGFGGNSGFGGFQSGGGSSDLFGNNFHQPSNIESGFGDIYGNNGASVGRKGGVKSGFNNNINIFGGGVYLGGLSGSSVGGLTGRAHGKTSGVGGLFANNGIFSLSGLNGWKRR